MRNPEQPGSKWRHILEVLQGHESTEESVLYYVLTVDDGSHQPGAIAVQLRSHFGGQGDQSRLAVVARQG
jgi:hypothetical protein